MYLKRKLPSIFYNYWKRLNYKSKNSYAYICIPYDASDPPRNRHKKMLKGVEQML